MNEHPLIYSPPMVQSTLDGLKTQTRRIITPYNSKIGSLPQSCWHELDWNDVVIDKGIFHPNSYLKVKRPEDDTRHRVFPRMMSGDWLYVRENWRPVGWDWEGDGFNIQYCNGDILDHIYLFEDSDDESAFMEKIIEIMDSKTKPDVDEENESFSWTKDQIIKYMPWRPSIHLPKLGSRIWLELTNIRAERLQDISEEDAIAEGIEKLYDTPDGGAFKAYMDKSELRDVIGIDPISSLLQLWDSIHDKSTSGNQSVSSEDNPWVWVYDFEVLSKGGRPVAK